MTPNASEPRAQNDNPFADLWAAVQQRDAAAYRRASARINREFRRTKRGLLLATKLSEYAVPMPGAHVTVPRARQLVLLHRLAVARAWDEFVAHPSDATQTKHTTATSLYNEARRMFHDATGLWVD